MPRDPSVEQRTPTTEGRLIILTLAAILVVALVAHLTGRPTARERGSLASLLDSRSSVAFIFLVSFAVLWYSWGAITPIPSVHDELAYVLQAQIFAQGKWALPSQPIPAFWEQPHVLVEPTVAAKYFPGHAIVMSVGALVGWLPLMPLVLQSCIAALLFVLVRRIASGGVALLTWILWLTTPMVLYFGASYYSESTTTLSWLCGWYALLEWRASRRLRWLLAVAFFTAWGAVTRPLTGVAYAIPMGIVVLYDVITGRRWRDLALALGAGLVVLAILPIWSAHTTGDWRVTPLLLYTRMYMPYDVPGFGLLTTPPAHAIPPELVQLNTAYSAMHVDHLPSNLPRIFAMRARYLSVSVWGVTSGVIGLFALVGIRTLTRETAFAVGTGVLLLIVYLAFATPAQWTLYYYESVPGYAYLSAAGLAWLASLFGRPRAVPPAPTFSWRSPRWTRALVFGGLGLALPGLVALRIIHLQHREDRVRLLRFYALLATIHDTRAVMFVRHSTAHDPHVQFVQNSAHPLRERIWVVYDRGDRENARLLSYAPERKAYLFDEARGRTYNYEPRKSALTASGVR